MSAWPGGQAGNVGLKGGQRVPAVGLGAAEIPAFARATQKKTPLQEAHAALALATAPSRLPCRDAERAQISRFIQDAVLAGSLLCLSLHVASMPESVI